MPVAALPVAHPTLPIAAHAAALPGAGARYGWGEHAVRPGESLFDLALRHRVSVDALVSRNRLLTADVPLHAGQRLQVPRLRPASAPTLTPGAVRRDGGHVVRPGETVSGIALRYGVGTQAMLRANDLDADSIIRPGQRLVVPEARAKARTATTSSRSAAARVRTRSVTVRPGDTLHSIAQRYGVSRARVIKANGLSLNPTLTPGRRLRITAVPAAGVGVGADTGATTRTRARRMIVDTARRHGVDPSLALAVGWQESGWNQRVVSSAGAIGVMQCLPSTGRWVGEQLGRRLDLHHTQDNITCGVALLRGLLRSTTSEREAIAGYYQGLASVRSRGMYTDTRAYVASVLALKARM